jgi:hypothetical protein
LGKNYFKRKLSFFPSSRIFFLVNAEPSVLKIRIYKTIILHVLLYEFEIWSLTLREEYGLRLFENRVLRRIFEPRRDEVTGNGENCITKSFMIYTLDKYN